MDIYVKKKKKWIKGTFGRWCELDMSFLMNLLKHQDNKLKMIIMVKIQTII